MKKGLFATLLLGSGLLFSTTVSAASYDQYSTSPGDTMWEIAQKFNVDLQDLDAVNPQITNINKIDAWVNINLPTHHKTDWEATADQVISTGKTQLGVPYVFGGSTPYKAFDCSGFIQYAFRGMGIELPHSAEMMSQMGTPVSADNLRKGDLIFLSGTYKAGVSHVAIYLGNNKILHASTAGTREVKISNLFGTPYYDAHYSGARRIIQS